MVFLMMHILPYQLPPNLRLKDQGMEDATDEEDAMEWEEAPELLG